MKSSKDVSAPVFNSNRLEALADGVFAIVMTLLVLEISIPAITGASVNKELSRALLEMWPKLFAYVVSFLVLGVIWINHHFIFHHIKQADSKLSWINIIFLMFVALVPFSTTLLGEYRQTQAATAVYGANIFLIIVMALILWIYVTGKRRLVDSGINPELVRRRKMMFLTTSPIFLIAIVISFINPVIAFYIYGLIAVYSIISTWIGWHGFLHLFFRGNGEKK